MFKYFTTVFMVIAMIGLAFSPAKSSGSTQYTILATAHGDGTISPSDSVTVDQGTDTTFTMTADPGYHLDSVVVDGVNEGAQLTYTFNDVQASHTIDAYFSIDTYTITASVNEGGSISPSGSVVVELGADQSFTVTADAGHHLDSLVVDSYNVGNETSWTFDSVTTDHTIRAYFSIDKFTIMASATGGGSISPSGSVVLDFASDQTFTITADAGYHLDSLLVDGVNQGDETSWTFDSVTTNHTIDAFFSVNTYTITATACTGGSISPSGSVVVEEGMDTTFTVTTDWGYNFDSLVVDGVSVGAETSWTFDSVTTDHTIKAHFSRIAVTIDFAVNMKIEALKGNFNPMEDSVYVGGTFSDVKMEDGDNDSVYTASVSDLYAGDTLMFKFGYWDESMSVLALENDPAREFVVPDANDTYSDYFDRDSSYNPVENVTFTANMWVKALKGTFNPAEDIVFISGSFNGWSDTDTLWDGDSDSAYSITLQPGFAGDTLQFKFRFWDASESDFVWESDPNREYVIPGGGGTYEDFFDRDSVYVEQHDIAVTFSVNMELERLSGRFDPATDTVSVNGTFNGWSPKTDILEASLLNADIYEKTVTIRAGVGETINFKFWYTDNNWESISDRAHTFTQEEIDNLAAEISGSFNNGSLDNVINQTCTITFTCNTNGAVPTGGGSFTNIHSVSIAGSASPLQWPNGGWPNSDSSKVIALFDDGTNGDVTASDGIFSAEVTFPTYTLFDVQYKYSINFGDSLDNGSSNDNEAGFGENHTLHMTKYMSSATAVDTFGTMQDTDLRDAVGIPSSVKAIPHEFSLGQNYPNPFNPSTTIKYDLAAKTPVVLNVYDMLGRVVSTVVNESQDAGSYSINFSANNLPSGLYYYRIVTATFTQTKTMLLVK